MVKLHRRRSAAVKETDRAMLPMIRQLKAEHPFWGYRRIWAYLRFVERLVINKKRIYRLLRENDLLVKGNEKLKARRVSGESEPRPREPNSWWGVEMTKVLTAEGGAYLVVVNDWFTRKDFRRVCRKSPSRLRLARSDESSGLPAVSTRSSGR